MNDRPAPLHVILGGVPCEDDGPIRDEDDNSQRWHDLFSEDELVAALRVHAARLERKYGPDSFSQDVAYAADCIEDLCEIRDKLVTQIAKMAGAGMEVSDGIERVRQSLRASIESLSKPL